MGLQLQKEGFRLKLLIKLSDKELSKYLNFTNSFIIGLKDYSVSYFELDIESIKELLNKYNIELFVSINKNIFNKDLDNLKAKLIELSKLNIKGILFYDLSILSFVKELNLNIDLVYHQTHMVTNYNICEFYKELGCKYAYLSTEITEMEMDEISQKTDINLITYFIGHPIISHSKRKLVSNFYKHLNKKNNNNINIMKENNKDNKYYVEENNIGTNILTYDILNGSRAFINLKDKISYGVLDSYLIDNDIFLKVLELFYNNLNDKISNEEFIEKVSNLIGNYDGFFYQKTIYKVKK